MTKKQKLKLLRKAFKNYNVNCIDGCYDCCGLVPISTLEKSLMKNVKETTELDCPYRGDAGCSNYSERPIICRAYGAVNISMLVCEHGCRPKKMMPTEEFLQIMEYYIKEILTEEDKKANHEIAGKHQAAAFKNFIEEMKVNPTETLIKVFNKHGEIKSEFEQLIIKAGR